MSALSPMHSPTSTSPEESAYVELPGMESLYADTAQAVVRGSGTYHEQEFASERKNYWSRDQQGYSEWHGQLAKDWGLSGSVGDEHFDRLTEGHPFTEG